MNQELETLIEKLEALREKAKRALLEDKAQAFDIAVGVAQAMIRSRPAEEDQRPITLAYRIAAWARSQGLPEGTEIRTDGTRIEIRLPDGAFASLPDTIDIGPIEDHLDRWLKGHREGEVKHPAKIDLEDQASDWARKNQIEARTEASRGPRENVVVTETTPNNGVTGMKTSKAPRWLRHAVRYIFFLVLTVALWKVTVDWLAGDAGTSVAGRITAAFFGLVALLLVSAYITEFNQKHD
jgi:hypothetical protein